jgi:hypothetical protein
MASHLRPAFRRAFERWVDLAVTLDEDGVLTLSRASTASPQHVALVVVGMNVLDPRLFERTAAHHINRFIEDGWSVRLLDLDLAAASGEPVRRRTMPPGPLVAKLLVETERLRWITFFTHSRHAINLCDSGEALVVHASSDMSAVRIADLRLSGLASNDGWVDVFGCYCRPEARWASEMAKAFGWPVRTVYPGYGIYFPSDQDYPRSAIPFTRAFSRARYSERGWAVWLPNGERPVRVSQPGEIARRYETRFDTLERIVVNAISVGLEPVRDFRKLRRLKAHVHHPPADPEAGQD